MVVSKICLIFHDLNDFLFKLFYYHLPKTLKYVFWYKSRKIINTDHWFRILYTYHVLWLTFLSHQTEIDSSLIFTTRKRESKRPKDPLNFIINTVLTIIIIIIIIPLGLYILENSKKIKQQDVKKRSH